jgi:MFS family permease
MGVHAEVSGWKQADADRQDTAETRKRMTNKPEQQREIMRSAHVRHADLRMALCCIVRIDFAINMHFCKFMSSPSTLPSNACEARTAAPYWPLWIACLLGYAAMGMTIQVMPAFAQQHMGAGAFGAGLAVTVGSLAAMLARPLAGRLADQRGPRGIVLAGSALGVTGGIGHLLAIDLPTLIAARLLLGAGEGALFTAAIAWVLADVEPARRGQVAGQFGASMWLGLAGGPVLGAALLWTSGFRGVWIVASLLPALAWLLVVLAPHAAHRTLPVDRAPRSLVPRAAWLPGASNIAAGISYGTIAAFLVPRFESLQLPGQQLALAVFGLSFITCRLIGSGWVDRFGARRVLLASFVIEAVALGGLAVNVSAALAFQCVVLAGAGLSLLYPCLATLVSKDAPARERATALGAVTSAWDLGVAVGGPLGGLVAGANHAPPFVIGAVAALCATLPMMARRH